jgi:hypothetical protein
MVKIALSPPPSRHVAVKSARGGIGVIRGVPEWN